MILIDTNSLLVLIIGLIDTNLLKTHRRTSIYEKEDFENLLFALKGKFENLLVIPNIWTEVDNLLNNSFTNNHKNSYIFNLRELLKLSSEKYLASEFALNSTNFFDLGITDTLILEVAKDCDFIISSDSKLSDYAKANSIKVYDLIEIRNKKLFDALSPKP